MSLLCHIVYVLWQTTEKIIQITCYSIHKSFFTTSESVTAQSQAIFSPIYSTL